PDAVPAQRRGRRVLAGDRPARSLLGRAPAGEVPRRRVGTEVRRRDARPRGASLEASLMASVLWDTTGSDIVHALLSERRAAGALASGLALTLVTVVDEKHVREAEEAATLAA